MKIYATNAEDRLAEVQDVYHRARIGAETRNAKFRRYEKQYNGDGEIDDDLEHSGGRHSPPEDAKVVWNMSYKMLEGAIDTNLPQPFVTPELKSEHHIRNARRIENLIKMLMNKQPWETFNDGQERSVRIYGTTLVNVEWDNDANTHRTVGETKLTPLRPFNVYPQPGITSINECDYVFLDYITTRSSLKRRYSLSELDLEGTDFSATYERGDYDKLRPTNDDDVVTVTVLWYLNENGEVGRFSFSGSLILEDNEDYYARAVEYCKCCERRRQLCEKDPCSNPDYEKRKLEYDELEEDLECSDGRIIPAFTPEYKDGEIVFETVRMPVTDSEGIQMTEPVGGIPMPAFMDIQVPKMKKTRLPYYKPKKLPIAVRYNIRDENDFWGISLLEKLRIPQQEVNKLISRIQEAAMRQGAGLIMPDGVKIEPSNGIFKEIYKLKDNMDKNQFGQFEYGVDISSWVVMLEKFLTLGEDISGVTDTFLGQSDPSATSGYAKSIQVAQATGRQASVKVNKQAFFADIGRIIFELFLAFADEKRAIHHDDGDQESYHDMFCRNDYYEFDPNTGEYFVDDSYSFACDPNGAALEQQYVQLWDIVKSDFASGMYGDPTQIDTSITVWKHLERLRYPFARNIVESLKETKKKILEAQAQGQARAQANAQDPTRPNAQSSLQTAPQMTEISEV